ncbi:MAG: AI-2E family transporter [Ruminococcaceae bacterium]|nr:AI-2E family transporter [Oscillospiraceae bacterium]
MNSDSNKFSKKLLIFIVTAITIYILGNHFSFIAGVISYIWKLIMPLVVGVVFAMILNVPMSFFERHLFKKNKKKYIPKLRRVLSFVISVVIILGILCGIVILVAPQLYEAAGIIIEDISDYIKDWAEKEKSLQKENMKVFGIFNVDWNSVGNAFDSFVRNSGLDIVSGAVERVGGFIFSVVDIFIAVVIAVYILFSKESLKYNTNRVLSAWLPDKAYKPLVHVSQTFSGIFKNFVAGQTIEAFILGALCMLGMLLLRLPYSLTVGVLVGVTAYIPVIGALFGAFVGAFMIFAVSPVKALVFMIFLILLQQFEGNFIYPKLMGSRINLPAIWVLLAVTVGGTVYGAVGMLIAVPIASTLYVLFKEATVKREEAKIKEAEINEETE